MIIDPIGFGLTLRRVGCALLLLAGCGAFAQLVPQDPDWQELDIPPPPSFNRDGLIAVEMPSYVTLKFGVDPASLSVSSDQIVRYVMVAISPTGAVSAMFEGLRCNKGEFKTYARWSVSGKWLQAKDAQWRPLDDHNTSRHALAFARQGACDGRTATAGTAVEIIRKMKSQSVQF